MDWKSVLWALVGILIFGAFLYFAANRVRKTGKGSFADLIRAIWPLKP